MTEDTENKEVQENQEAPTQGSGQVATEEKPVAEQAVVEDQAATPAAENADWYIIQTYSGYEKKVKLGLEQRIKQYELESKVFKVLIPEEDTVEIKDNKRVEKTKKMYPGYVFINMIMDEDAWYAIRSVPGVAKFIGTSTRPEPVREKEMLRVLRQVGEKTQKVEVDFEVDDNIRVVDGPFRGYTGNISEINVEKGKVKVLISIFGRETPMELTFDQIERNT
ncbi:MAG: transcription termination/antitermination protein NusG [Candidatus Margulisbacteria bacterium]|nr:transcription termination/antitermination protein NusG [Candidatus Margulisiibacteriota bacterium]